MPDTGIGHDAWVKSIWEGTHRGRAEGGRNDQEGPGGDPMMDAGYALPFGTMLLTCRPGSSAWVWKEHCNAHHLVLAATGYPHP